MPNAPSDIEHLARSQFNPLILQLQNQDSLDTKKHLVELG